MIIGSQALPPMQGLRAFLAIAETASFTRAASELGLTQTAISHQIAQLETWLGGTLFVRSRRSVELTELGRSLLPEVTAQLEALQRVLGAARRRVSERQLVISTTPEFGTQWLAPRLERFVEQHPGIKVSLTLDYRRADLAAGEADVAIWLGQGDARLKAERLALEEEFAVSSPGLSARLPPTQALLAAPLLHYQGARNTVLDWRRWNSQLYGAGPDSVGDRLAALIDFDAGPSFPSFADMLEACRRGEGFALVRTSLVADDLAAGLLVRCFVETLPSDLHYHLVTAPQRRPSEAVTAFRRWILAEMALAPMAAPVG